MIVDIGGGSTEIAVISLGGIVSNNSIRIAGDDLTADIQEYMSRQHNVKVSELFEQIEKQSVAVTPVYVKNDVAQQAKKLSASSASTKTSSAKKHTTDKAKTSKPIAVREVKVVKQETATPAPAVKSQESANHPFHIIVAGGISLKDAEVIANQLKSKGFADAKALNTDGKVRVSISSFNNRDEATKQLLELRKNETYKNAWLLAK